MKPIKLFFLGLLFSAILTSCASYLGPKQIQRAHRPFNESVATALNEQLLLNLVRLKYRDNPYFIEVSGITSQTSLTGELAATSGTPFFNSRLLSPTGTLGYTNTPTVSYAPLQGEAFLSRLLAPIPMDAVAKLTQSGWSVSRVVRICVERANGLRNAVSASGPTPARSPEYLRFKDFAEGLREFQEDKGLNLVREDERIALFFDPTRCSEAEVCALLDIVDARPRQDLVFLGTKVERGFHPNELSIDNRSLMGILFYLSHNVEVPRRHIERGLVTKTINPDGSEFDWNDVTGDLLQVKMSPTPVPDAFVQISYRGHYFYIADNDLNSKSTFLMLNQLFNLQAGDQRGSTPVLTIPVGG
ncbi:MAG: hypothetical protein AAF236_11580 [Verrucomicrobiota bacterium]